MDPRETLTLPEPAATLWRRVHPVLDALEGLWPDTADLFTLGGGTVPLECREAPEIVADALTRHSAG